MILANLHYFKNILIKVKLVNKKTKFGLIIGTRPEIIKMAPIIHWLNNTKASYFIIHSGQHFTKNMNDNFLEYFGISSKIKYQIERKNNQSANLSHVIFQTKKILYKEKPYLFFIQGDTDTGFASAIAASGLNIGIGHIEAGLRSYDLSMQEERNRIAIDHLSKFNFCPTTNAVKNLRNEGLSNTFLVGNTIVDSLWYALNIDSRENIKIKKYILLTLHRPSNVDNVNTLNNLLKNISIVAQKKNIQVIFPIHPRTKKKLVKQYKNIKCIKPLDYFRFVSFEKNAQVILTDSGGVQEEACILKTPCITLRENTERQETINIGANVLCDGQVNDLSSKIDVMIEKKEKFNNDWCQPFGELNVAKKIFEIIL